MHLTIGMRQRLLNQMKNAEEVKITTNLSDVSHAKDKDGGKLSNNEVLLEKKNKKRTKESEGEAAEKQNLSASEKGKKQTETKPSQVRTFPNGLIIEEELFMGKPDDKKAAPGKKVSVKYIGKLQKDGGKYLTQMWESTLQISPG